MKYEIKDKIENLKKSFTNQTREQKIGLIIFLSILMFLIFGFILNQRKVKKTPISKIIKEQLIIDSLPRIVFEDKVYVFDTIFEGDSVFVQFNFINRGQQPLIISNVMTTCGCTTVDYTKDTVFSGSKGEVNILFTSKNKSGVIDKDISVMSNATNNDVFLRIEGFVK